MTVYVTEQGVSIHKQGERLVLRKGRMETGWFHAFQVEEVILFGNVSVTPQALAFCLEQGIDLILLSAQGRYRGRLVGPAVRNILLRRLQFQKYEDEVFRIGLVRSVVRAKVHNMRTLILRAARRRTLDLGSMPHRLRLIKEQLDRTTTIDGLRGLEGTATAVYFRAFKSLLDPAFSFIKRERRPPQGPVNAMLSFGYTLLANNIDSVVQLVGLDPHLGFLHLVDYGRPSLILDLMEEFRPVIVDSFVLNLVNHHRIGLEDFTERDGGTFLNETGRKKVIAQYQQRIETQISYPMAGGRVHKVTYKRCFELQARRLVQYIKGEIPAYVPYLIR